MPQLDFFSWQVIVEIIGLFTFLFYFLYLKNLISYIYLIEYV
jgi:hypothetical protein